MTFSIAGFLWCALAGAASALASLLIKFSNNAGADWTITKLAWLGAACGVYGLGFIAYSVALRKLDISLAYPVMTAVAMAMVALAGVLVLNETLTGWKLTGMVMVAAGAFALTR